MKQSEYIPISVREKTTLIDISEVFEKMNKQFIKDRDNLRNSYENNLRAIFTESGLKEKLLNHNWFSDIEQLQEGSCGEASENGCKKEVVSNFMSYLDEEEREFFGNGYIYHLAREVLEEEIL